MALPPELQYIVEGMVIHHDHTDDAGTFIHNYYDDAHVLDTNSHLDDIIDVIDSNFSQWLITAPKSQRNNCMTSPILNWRDRLSDLTDLVVRSAVEPLYKKLDSGRCEKELFSRKHIRRTIRRHKIINRAMENYRRFLMRFDFTDENLLDGVRITRENYNRYNRYKAQPKSLLKKKAKKDRKKNIKAVSMLSKIAGKDITQVYISGNHVSLKGSQFEFRIVKNQFNSHNYTANKIQLYDLNNTYLADLCVYVKDTPAAEHIAAYVMYIQAGLEEEIIRTGNLSNISSAGRENSDLQKFIPVMDKLINTDALNIYNFDLAAIEMDFSVKNNRRGMTSVINRYRDNQELSMRVREELVSLPEFQRMNELNKRMNCLVQKINQPNVPLIEESEDDVFFNYDINVMNRMNAAHMMRIVLDNRINELEETH